MPLEQPQALWLNRFSGGLVPLPVDPANAGDDPAAVKARREAAQIAKFRLIRDKEVAEELALKQVMIDTATQALENRKDDIRKAFAMTAKDGGKTVKSQDKHGDQTKEIDTKEIKHDTVVKGDQNAAHEMMELIAAQRTTLSNAQVTRSVLDEETFEISTKKQPLFEDKEITKEFYTPLVRELVIPENLVPKRFSATQNMVSGSNDYYIKECQEKGKDVESGGFEFVKGAVNVASQACAAAFGANTDTTAIVEGTAAILSVGIDGTKRLVNKELSASDWSTIAGGIAGPIGDIVGGVKADTYGGALIGDSIAAAVKGVNVAVRVGEWKRKGGKFPIAEIISDIGGAISSGLSAKSDVSSGEEAVKFGDASALAAEAGAVASKTFIAAMKADAAGLGDALADGDWKKARKLMLSFAVEAGVAAASEYSKAMVNFDVVDREDQAQKDATQTAQDTLDQDLATGADSDTLKADQDAVDNAAPDSETLLTIINQGRKSSDAVDESTEGLQALHEKLTEKYEKKEAKKDEEDEIKTVQAELKKEREEYEKSLQRLSTTEPSDEDFKSIAKLIEKIERDRMIMNTAVTIGGAAATVAKEFFAPLKAAGSLIKFLANLHAAIERAIALGKWVDARRGAVSAVSPYATSIENFVRNQADQFAHYTVQAALRALEAGSAAAETGYPPAKGLTLATGAAITLEDTIFKFYKQQALRKAWKTTKASLETPENRKLALIARRMNPTLAKYTIAYGALIERDVVAVRAMTTIGLDREALSRAGDQVGLVKSFLQVTYKDDGELLGKLPPTKNGRKVPTPALRTKPWMITHTLWTDDMELVGESPTEIIRLLSKAEHYADTATDVRGPKQETIYFEGRITTLQDLSMAFRTYNPKSKFGQPMPEVQSVLDAYVDLAEAEQEAVEQFAEARLG